MVTINASNNPITFTQANEFTRQVAINNSGANNVALTNNLALVLAASTVGQGTFTITANGPITQTGILTQGTSAGAAYASMLAPIRLR